MNSIDQGRVWRLCRALRLAVELRAEEHRAFSIVIERANEKVRTVTLFLFDLRVDLGKQAISIFRQNSVQRDALGMRAVFRSNAKQIKCPVPDSWPEIHLLENRLSIPFVQKIIRQDFIQGPVLDQAGKRQAAAGIGRYQMEIFQNLMPRRFVVTVDLLQRFDLDQGPRTAAIETQNTEFRHRGIRLELGQRLSAVSRSQPDGPATRSCPILWQQD